MDDPTTGPPQPPEAPLAQSPLPPETPSDTAPSGPAGGASRPLFDKIFLGPNGIRAGWRLLIFVVLMVIAAIVLGFLGEVVLKRLSPPPEFAQSTFGEGVAFLAALLASLVMGRIERRSFADYGLPARSAFGGEFWSGVLWGCLALSALLVLIHLGHAFDFGTLALGGKRLVAYAAFWGVTFLIVGFAEEYIFRGYALATLSTGMGFWPSALLLSAVFGAVHIQNPGEDWEGALAAGLIGLFLCLTLRRTGSLWFAIGVHAGWDYSESFLYSVPDSGAMVRGHLLNSSFHGPNWLTGGSVGPEGSALVFVVIAVLFLIFDRLHRDARFPLVVGVSHRDATFNLTRDVN